MVPLFTAFDRDIYRKIIPDHLANLHHFPKEAIECFKKGAFTVNLSGRECRSVAIDEAHEMCVNKDLKQAVIHPTQSYLQKTSSFLNYRIESYKNLMKQLYPKQDDEPAEPSVLLHSKESLKVEGNITHMISEITKADLLPLHSRDINVLVNPFTSQKATPEQEYDMLHFYDVGLQSYFSYINYYILKIPSTNEAPIRHKKLLTMALPKLTKAKLSQREKEGKLVNLCLRRRLAWCNQTGLSYNPTTEQYSPLPRALSDEYGVPHVVTKSSSIWKDKLQARYGKADPQIFSSIILDEWKPETAIINAMFLLSIKPLRKAKTITDYSHFLFNRFAIPYYKIGMNEVHFIFECSREEIFKPKKIMQKHKSCSTESHQHTAFTMEKALPAQKWQEYVSCTTCIRSIIESIGLALLTNVRFWLDNEQRMVLAGCFSGTTENTAWMIEASNIVPQPCPCFTSTADEAHLRIWRHAKQCTANSVLIYSPDNNVYNIGLGNITSTNKTYIIQTNATNATEESYIHLNNFISALNHDPDLASLPRDTISHILMVLYVCTGCDSVSYFKTIGKASFLNSFFKQSNFIYGRDPSMIGSLHQVYFHDRSEGFYCFIRMVGTVYFYKHLVSFSALYNRETPLQLYNSIDATLNPDRKHRKWIELITSVVAEHITTEEERLPSYTSLWRHWQRSCWTASLWLHASLPDPYSSLPLPENSGWLVSSEGKYITDWEDSNITSKVEANIAMLTKGCKCKSACKTNRCGCKKKMMPCGPGCECHGCMNLPHTEQTVEHNSYSAEETSDNSDSDNSNYIDDNDDMMDFDNNTETELITEEFAYVDTF